VSTKEEGFGEGTDREDVTEEHSFDELARGLATGAISRGQALKLVGGGILGAALGFVGLGFFDADAEARGRHSRHRRRRHKHRRRICPVGVKAGCGVTCVCPLGTSCNGAGICK
jgi:hypothetical protein